MRKANPFLATFMIYMIVFAITNCTRNKNILNPSFKSFAIYFLQDSNLTYWDTMTQPINSFKLSNPIATQNGISYYKIYYHPDGLALTHAIIFKKDMTKLFGNINRPFMIIANGDKIYIGDYWANFMNTNPPDIIMYPYKKNEFHLLSTEKGAKELNDYRIMEGFNELRINIVYLYPR
jgi:hypothetical protein